MEQIRDVLISISSKLLDSHTEEMDSVITQALDECRVSLEVDRLSCLPLHNTVLDNAFHYESIGKGVPQVVRKVPEDVIIEYRELIQRGEVACSDSSPEILDLASRLQPEKPLRHILVPISAMGKPWGLMACANFTSEKIFDDEFIESATLLGNVIASSIARLAHYQELKRSRQEVAKRNWLIIGERERERRNIARDLHDDFGQRLASLGLDLAFASNVCDDRSREVIHKCEVELASITRDMQHLSRHLHPVVIERVGLNSAVTSYIRQIAGRIGLGLDIDLDDSIQFDDETSLHIFRIIQESLSNVIKHAHANNVSVALCKTANGIELTISDDGFGFAGANLKMDSASLGMRSMHERAELIGGVITVEAQAPGVLVRLTIKDLEEA